MNPLVISLVSIMLIAWASVGVHLFRKMPGFLGRNRNPELCHKYTSGSWADSECNGCGKSPNNWRHWPKRLEPHPFDAHIRRDIGTMTSYCDLCNKLEGFRMHKIAPTELDGDSKKIKELEEWHNNFRCKHPEFEDHQRNHLFPELAPSALREDTGLSIFGPETRSYLRRVEREYGFPANAQQIWAEPDEDECKNCPPDPLFHPEKYDGGTLL